MYRSRRRPFDTNVNDAILRPRLNTEAVLLKEEGSPTTSPLHSQVREVDLRSIWPTMNHGATTCSPIPFYLEQGHPEEAEEVYRADIELWKDNMWGLLGLKLCLRPGATTVAN